MKKNVKEMTDEELRTELKAIKKAKHLKLDVAQILEKSPDLSFLKDINCSLGANGKFFSNNFYGFLPELMDEIFKERAAAKKTMVKMMKEKRPEAEVKSWDVQQQAWKILANSGYGALGSEFFAWFNIDIAEAITYSGQLSIQWVEKAINAFMNEKLATVNEDYVVAGDTDSNYICMDKLVKENFDPGAGDKEIVDWLDSFCKTELQPVIDSAFKELAEYMGAYSNRMVMNREVIASRGLWTAKKRYALNVHNSEGVAYDTPELKVMGLEIVRSSTPKFIRDKLKESVRIILTTEHDTDRLHDYVKEVREEFFSWKPEDIALASSANNLKKYSDYENIYGKKTPIHVRGCLLHNYLITKNDLNYKYNYIHEGEKVLYTYLVVPNPLHENVISFIGILPKEFELHEFIDYDIMFEKTFLEPLQAITEKIHWSPEPKASLRKFFV